MLSLSSKIYDISSLPATLQFLQLILIGEPPHLETDLGEEADKMRVTLPTIILAKTPFQEGRTLTARMNALPDTGATVSPSLVSHRGYMAGGSVDFMSLSHQDAQRGVKSQRDPDCEFEDWKRILELK